MKRIKSWLEVKGSEARGVVGAGVTPAQRQSSKEKDKSKKKNRHALALEHALK